MHGTSLLKPGNHTGKRTMNTIKKSNYRENELWKKKYRKLCRKSYHHWKNQEKQDTFTIKTRKNHKNNVEKTQLLASFRRTGSHVTTGQDTVVHHGQALSKDTRHVVRGSCVGGCVCWFIYGWLTGWWFGTWPLFCQWEFHHQLTFIFFRGVGIPPTSFVCN